MPGSAAQTIARPEPASHRLTVLIALGDAARAEQLADALAASDDLLPILAGSSMGQTADVALVDEAALESRAVSPATPCVLFSRRAGHERPAGNVFATLPASADSLLIAAALRLAASGYRISRAAPSEVAAHGDFHGDLSEDETTDEPRAALSQREAEVLALLAEGAPNKVIARRLNISVHTAKFHVAAILVKLGAANRTDAIAIAMRQGLVLV
ncbi:LuxR family transcriptional regulator [Mesorhizobium tamadayense]|uniref:LuxR family transcriptional regulator n=1 Tax=Mesorhizobium tamadayense TaxID=425306 RepID=A0A3P3FX16_9HYPH|nr:helix-turn-helix transcriptional regulator [Mesorhizobium tamadayense]RRI03131.1 LuxR family transcriptional regulator [Mesorhizobium tamadayense]